MSEWIEWSGGECPVDLNAVVEAKLRLRIHTDEPIRNSARSLRWDHSRGPDPECPNGFSEGNADIVAYRVVA